MMAIIWKLLNMITGLLKGGRQQEQQPAAPPAPRRESLHIREKILYFLFGLVGGWCLIMGVLSYLQLQASGPWAIWERFIDGIESSASPRDVPAAQFPDRDEPADSTAEDSL